MNPITWLLSLWKKKPATRKPRRPKCACAHWWHRHGRQGCRQCIAVEAPHPCRLNREGKPARRALAAVKEGAA